MASAVSGAMSPSHRAQNESRACCTAARSDANEGADVSVLVPTGVIGSATELDNRERAIGRLDELLNARVDRLQVLTGRP